MLLSSRRLFRFHIAPPQSIVVIAFTRRNLCSLVSRKDLFIPTHAVPLAAPLTPDYPQFVPVETPNDGITVSAWRGIIQPFMDDETARSVLADVEAERTLFIAAGSICGGGKPVSHWANPLLVDMNVKCEVLICIQPEALPRAYLLKPRFEVYYENLEIHPHPRGDQAIKYAGARIPGLCVVSGAEFVFNPDQNFHTQFLDQVTQYVAKHLIWLKTRRLYRLCESRKTALYTPHPGEVICERPPTQHIVALPTGPVSVCDFWSGYWPGKGAKAMNPLEHIRQIRLNQRCWCGLAKEYAQCHRPLDLAQLSPQSQLRYSGQSQ